VKLSLEKIDEVIDQVQDLGNDNEATDDLRLAWLIGIVEDLAIQLREVIGDHNNHRHGYRWEKQ
jgi:hypothetical protein